MNPIDELEDVIEAAGYDFNREGNYRIRFLCAGDQDSYDSVIEWNADAGIFKLSAFLTATKKRDDDAVTHAIDFMNETSWTGIFGLDGVGNTIFRMLVSHEQAGDHAPDLEWLEDHINVMIREVDKFLILLSLSSDTVAAADPMMFADEVNSVETLDLLFMQPKGTA